MINLPDENIVRVLEERRGNGRDDFPVRAMWNALIAGIVFQHASVESLRKTDESSPPFHMARRVGLGLTIGLERINSRLDNDFDFEKHYIRGQAKMQTRVGLATAVMMAMALGHVRAGRIEQMRSLVRPIARAA